MAVQSVSSVKPQSPVKKAAKNIVKTVFWAGAITAGLALGSKHDVFNKASDAISKNLKNEKGQELVKNIAKKLTGAGKSIEGKATPVINAIKTKVKNAKLKDLTVYKEANRLAQDLKTSAQKMAQNLI